MVKIYEGIWEHGKLTTLKPNYHYKKKVGSLIVPHGYVATFYKNQDRTGGKSYPFYEGMYHDLTFYNVPKNPGVIHVEKTNLRTQDLLEVGCYPSWQQGGKKVSYYKFMKIPIGEWKGGNHFWDNAISHFFIPFGVVVEVFDKEDFKDGSLIFAGENENGATHVGLPDYDYGWKASSIRITADDWVSAGLRLTNERITDGDDIEGGTITLNNDSPHAAEVTDTITKSVEEGKEESWDARFGVTASAKLTVGPETCQGEFGIEISAEAGFGETKSKSKSREVSHEVKVIVDGYGQAKASLLIKTGKMEADLERVWRNVRTGAEVVETGKITIEQASQTEVTLTGGKWAPNAKTPQIQDVKV